MKAIYSRNNKKQTALVQCMLLFLLLKIGKAFALKAKLNELLQQNETPAEVPVIYSGSNGSKEDE